MKYLSLPVHIIKFWYLEALVFFARAWKNSLLYLEEDLAVGLMLNSLFMPMLPNASIFSKILSFFYRFLRILLGIFAYLLVTIFLITFAIFWFLLPILAVVLTAEAGFLAKILFFSGIVLFVNHLVIHPHKKLWQLKSSDQIWKSSFIKKKDLNLFKLMKTYQVKELLSYLEQTPDKFAHLPSDFDEREVLEHCREVGKKLVTAHLGPEHFFTALIFSLPLVENELAKLNLAKEDFLGALDYLKKRKEKWRIVFPWDEDFEVTHLKITPKKEWKVLDFLKEKSIEAERYKKIKVSFLAMKEIAQNSIDINSALQTLQQCLPWVKDKWITKSVVDGINRT